MRPWLDRVRGQVPPRVLTGKALTYLDVRWPRLIRYLDDGRIEIDNNQCENAIRPFVLGRKAWLFADTPAGAQASARLYSLVETAKANGLEPYAYLKRVFEDLPAAIADNDDDAIKRLLPWNVPDADAQRRPAHDEVSIPNKINERSIAYVSRSEGSGSSNSTISSASD